jgi:hypothetical protein
MAFALVDWLSFLLVRLVDFELQEDVSTGAVRACRICRRADATALARPGPPARDLRCDPRNNPLDPRRKRALPRRGDPCGGTSTSARSFSIRFHTSSLPTDRTATVQMRPVKSGEDAAEGGSKPAASSGR